MDVKELEEILTKATDAMVKSLNSFGPSETLKLLVKYSHDDWILRELLARFPSIVTINHFLFGKPIIKIQMTNQGLECLSDTKFPFFIREQNEPREDCTVRRKAPRVSKKTRCPKCKTR